MHDDDVPPTWDEGLSGWRDLAARATGNPVNVIDLSASELYDSSTEAWLQAALREGVVLAGRPLSRLMKILRG